MFRVEHLGDRTRGTLGDIDLSIRSLLREPEVGLRRKTSA